MCRVQVASQEYKTFKDLMYDLTYRYQMTELEKARAIFRCVIVVCLFVLKCEM